ncbi:MAG: inorganic phosphate transporter, partial [Candidatus Humimicrobiaceae bacterium]
MVKIIFLIALVTFFAMNMGASGIVPTFSAVYGGRLINRKAAVLLFTTFVILGAVTLGKAVVKTLSQGLIPKQTLNLDVALIILASATLSLFLANLLTIPESTSMVTVGAVTGVGLYL